MAMGYVFASAAMHEGKNVTYLPSYGAEMRGGTANCTISISDAPIASPVASFPDMAVLMNAPSVVRFAGKIKSGGTILLNSDLVEQDILRDDVEVIRIRANAIAGGLGNVRCANMVMLGALVEKSRLVGMDAVIKSVDQIFGPKGPKIRDMNLRALEQGVASLREACSESGGQAQTGL